MQRSSETARSDSAATELFAPAPPPPSEASGATPLRVDGPVVDRARSALFAKPALAVATLMGLAVAIELVPGLARLRLFGQRPEAPAATAPMATAPKEIGEATLETESKNTATLEPESDRAEERSPEGTRAGLVAPPIETEEPPLPLTDASGKALDGFYAALAETALGKAGAVTRIAHFGDSIIVSDFVSGTLRRIFQREFGDAGHGYMLIANAWPAYAHNDVYRFASSGWKVSRIVGPLAPDGLYGLGGVSFKAPPGVRARFGTEDEGQFGRSVSRFVLSYLEQPGGGRIEINVDGSHHADVDAAGPEKRVRAYEVKVPDGPHQFEIVTRTGMPRAFGVVLERNQAGVVLDALGVQGARIRFLDKMDDEHFAEQLRWRSPDLVIFQFGANESGDGFAYPMPEYYATMRAVLEQTRRALPDSGCLVLSAMDRARRKDNVLESLPIIPLIVKEQTRAAHDVGCAFFDTYRAMGGHGSMATWVRRGLGQADLTHPTGVGSQVLGKWIFRALMQGYNAYLARR